MEPTSLTGLSRNFDGILMAEWVVLVFVSCFSYISSIVVSLIGVRASISFLGSTGLCLGWRLAGEYFMESSVDPSCEELADPEVFILDDVEVTELLFLCIPRLLRPPNPLCIDMDWLREVVDVYWLGEWLDSRLSRKLLFMLVEAEMNWQPS